MKTFLIIALCLAVVIYDFEECNAQNASELNKEIVVIAPVLASEVNVKGVAQDINSSAINNYLHNNLIYPEGAINCCFQGIEVVRFTVLPTRDLANIEVVNSICPLIDKEVIRVLNTTNGMWTPGTHNGNPVEMEKEVLIVFHLEGFHLKSDETYFTKKATNWYMKGNHVLFEHKNREKALKCYNNALRYKPFEEALLYARGMVKYELNDITGAKNDWNRMKSLVERGVNETNLPLVSENFNDFSGYIEFLK